MQKTYAVKGLMEFQALIPAGRSVIRVPFTGGSLSGYGVTPATFTTSDPAMQHLIELSADFRRGRITLHRSRCLPPDHDMSAVTGDAVRFTDAREAREYLAEHCGVERDRLRSGSAIAEAARECGVELTP